METTTAFTFFEQFFGIIGVGLFWFALVFYATFFGSQRIKQLALSVPLTLFLFGIVPASIIAAFGQFFPVNMSSFVLFGLLYALSFFVVRRINNNWEDTSGVMESVLTASALTFLIMLASYAIIHPDTLAPYYPDFLEPFFTNAQHTFWIVLISLVLLVIV